MFDCEVRAIEPDVIAWRRHLHQYPEVSFEEVATTLWLEARLRYLEQGKDRNHWAERGDSAHPLLAWLADLRGQLTLLAPLVLHRRSMGLYCHGFFVLVRALCGALVWRCPPLNNARPLSMNTGDP